MQPFYDRRRIFASLLEMLGSIYTYPYIKKLFPKLARFVYNKLNASTLNLNIRNTELSNRVNKVKAEFQNTEIGRSIYLYYDFDIDETLQKPIPKSDSGYFSDLTNGVYYNGDLYINVGGYTYEGVYDDFYSTYSDRVANYPEEFDLSNRQNKNINVTVSNGVTSLDGYTVPESVKMSETVDGYGDYTGTLDPNTLPEFYSPFYSFNHILSLSLSESVNFIDVDKTFYGLFEMIGLDIPTVGNDIIFRGINTTGFGDCTSLTVNSNNTTFKSVNNTIYSKDGKILVYSMPRSTTGGSTQILNTAEEIGRSAFAYRDGINQITIPDTVKYIRYGAFAGHKNLRNLTIETGVLDIEDFAFAGSPIENLVINCPVKYHWGQYDYNNLPFVYENNTAYMQSAIVGYVHRMNDKRQITNTHLKTLQVGITGGGEIYSDAFNTCPFMTDVTIGSYVSEIGMGAFLNCSSVRNLDFTDGVSNNDTTNLDVNTVHKTTAIVPLNIMNRAFYGCSSLTNLEMSKRVGKIQPYAFSNLGTVDAISLGCVELTKLYPELSALARYDYKFYPIFDGTESTDLVLNSDVYYSNLWTVTKNLYYWNCELSLAGSITTLKCNENRYSTMHGIGTDNFRVYNENFDASGKLSVYGYTNGSGNYEVNRQTQQGYIKLENVYLGGTNPHKYTCLYEVGDRVFYRCPIVNFDTGNSDYTIEFGKNALCYASTYYADRNSINEFYIRSDIEFAGTEEYMSPTTYQSVTPKVKSINNLYLYRGIHDTTYTLGYRYGIDNPSINPNFNITGTVYIGKNCSSIYSHAFHNKNYNFDFTQLPNNKLLFIGDGAFYDNSSLLVNDFARLSHQNIIYLGEWSFYNLNYSGKITLSVNFIGVTAFRNCKATEIELYNVIRIGDSAFTNCPNLTKVTIHFADTETVESFGMTNAPYRPDIDEVFVGIGRGAFYMCPNLTTVIIDGVCCYIKDEAFYGCTSLVTYSGNAYYYGDSVFSGCTSLADIQFGRNAYHIGYQCIYNTAYYNDGNNWVHYVGENLKGLPINPLGNNPANWDGFGLASTTPVDLELYKYYKITDAFGTDCIVYTSPYDDYRFHSQSKCNVLICDDFLIECSTQKYNIIAIKDRNKWFYDGIMTNYDNSVTYHYGDCVFYIYRVTGMVGWYRCIVSNSQGVQPYGDSLSSTNWGTPTTSVDTCAVYGEYPITESVLSLDFTELQFNKYAKNSLANTVLSIESNSDVSSDPYCKSPRIYSGVDMSKIPFPVSISSGAFYYCRNFLPAFDTSGSLSTYYIGDNVGVASSVSEYDTTVTYHQGQTVRYDNNLYSCKVTYSTPGPFNINEWTILTGGNYYSRLQYLIGDNTYYLGSVGVEVGVETRINGALIEVPYNPSGLSGLSVPKIYATDFLGTNWIGGANQPPISSLTFSNDCKYISEAFGGEYGSSTSSFYTYNNIFYYTTQINLGGVKYVGNYAFCGCNRLETLLNYNNLRYIGDYAFVTYSRRANDNFTYTSRDNPVALTFDELPPNLRHMGWYSLVGVNDIIGDRTPETFPTVTEGSGIYNMGDTITYDSKKYICRKNNINLICEPSSGTRVPLPSDWIEIPGIIKFPVGIKYCVGQPIFIDSGNTNTYCFDYTQSDGLGNYSTNLKVFTNCTVNNNYWGYPAQVSIYPNRQSIRDIAYTYHLSRSYVNGIIWREDIEYEPGYTPPNNT